MNIPKIKSWINENNQNGVTVLLPGGFKPTTGAHLELIRRYSQNPVVKEVKVIVGPKTRNGIDQNLGVKIAQNLTNNLPNVIIEKSQYPSPLLTAYKTIETLKPGNYALGASTKGDDYARVVNFTNEHQPNGKYYEGVPKGVNIIELPINADPAVYKTRDGEFNGQPISASILRRDVLDGNYKQFASGYPENDEHQIKNVWNMLQGKVEESYQYGYYLNESVVSKVNKHMTHAEDLVILSGQEGLKWVLKMMWDLYDDLKGNTKKSDMKLSVKIDGAPAIFAWSEFSKNLSKNGIAMKGLFAKIPKVFTTEKEINDNFGDRPDLAYKLKTFLKYLPKINIPKGEIWQGDFLFDDKSLQTTKIDDKNYYAFHPNTIYYVVPQDSDLGKLISKADIGITWHTRYTGENLENIQANYNTDASELTMIDKMLMTDPYIKSFAGLVNFTDEESNYTEKSLEELSEYSKNLSSSKEYKKIIENKNLIALFNIFQNSLIKINKTIEDPDEFIKDFIEFLQNRSLKEVEKRKSEAGKEKIMSVFAEFIDDIEQNKNEWFLIIHIIIKITKLKSMFIKKLNNIGKFQTYLKMKEGGLRVTNQEGFAVSDMEGNVVKLVSRNEFSWSNFSPDVVKGWEAK
jgi:hypothetical protein